MWIKKKEIRVYLTLIWVSGERKKISKGRDQKNIGDDGVATAERDRQSRDPI